MNKIIPFLVIFMISIFTNCQGQNKVLQIGNKFPTLEAQTLEDKKIIFPDETKGKFTVLATGFSQKAQEPINTWTDFILKEYPEFNYYEIPIGNSYYALFGKTIDNAMKKAVPKDLHSKTATYYGNLSQSYIEQFGVTDKSTTYVFLLNKEGTIIYKNSGFVNETIKTEFKTALNNNN